MGRGTASPKPAKSPVYFAKCRDTGYWQGFGLKPHGSLHAEETREFLTSPVYSNAVQPQEPRGLGMLPYSVLAARRTDQCCAVTPVSARLSSVVTYGTNATALFTAKS
jgi:hypothetical protein